jgi:transposase
LQRGAQAFGYEDERWTLDRIQRLVAERYGVSYNTNYLSEKLRKSGWSVQQPVRVAREREEALVTERLREHWPRIKKRPGVTKQ